MLPDVIDGGRFRLRPFRSDDLDAVFAYASDDEFLRYLPLAKPYTLASAQDFLEQVAQRDRDVNPHWALDIGGRASGGINVRFSAEHRIAELGYAVARTAWGRGFATEMARLVVGLAVRHHPELVRIRATADARNVASIRVMEKLGMRREALLRSDRLCRGELCDCVVYGLLRAEWPGSSEIVDARAREDA